MREVSVIEFFSNRIFLETLGQSRRGTKAFRQWWTHAGGTPLPRFSGEGTEGRGNSASFFCFLRRKQSAVTRRALLVQVLPALMLVEKVKQYPEPRSVLGALGAPTGLLCPMEAGWLLFSICLGPCSASSTTSKFWQMRVFDGTRVLLRAELKSIAKDMSVCFRIEQLSLNTHLMFQCSTLSELNVLFFLFAPWLKRDRCAFMAHNKDIAHGDHILTPGSIHPCIWQCCIVRGQPDCWASTKIKLWSSCILIRATSYYKSITNP